MNIKSLSKPVLIFTVASAVITGTSVYAWQDNNRPELLEIYVFPLKSGDIMFIRTPDDKRILINGGPNSEVIRHLSQVIPFYSRRIDKIFITNTEDKNITGIIDILERYKVSEIYLPKFDLNNTGISSSTSNIYKTLLSTLDKYNIIPNKISSGEKVILGSEKKEKASSATINSNNTIDEVIAEIIFPIDPSKFTYSKASRPELLFSVNYKDNKTYYLGGASLKVQKFLANNVNPSMEQKDILVVSQSDISANFSEEILNKIKPKSLIYSKLIKKEAETSSKKKPKQVVNKTIANNITPSPSVAIKNKTLKTRLKSDPLAFILFENRFNIKEFNRVKIVVDAGGMVIKGK